MEGGTGVNATGKQYLYGESEEQGKQQDGDSQPEHERKASRKPVVLELLSKTCRLKKAQAEPAKRLTKSLLPETSKRWPQSLPVPFCLHHLMHHPSIGLFQATLERSPVVRVCRAIVVWIVFLHCQDFILQERLTHQL